MLLLHLENVIWKWCGMPVLPWRVLFGRQMCSLLHQYRVEFGKWPLGLELHQPRRVFSALLICLSYLAVVMLESRTPRCCDRQLLIPNQAGSLAPSRPIKKGLPDMDLNHDFRFNRPAGCHYLTGE